MLVIKRGHAVAQSVEGLCYKSRDRIPMVSLEFFIDIVPSDFSTNLESNEPFTDMSTRNIF